MQTHVPDVTSVSQAGGRDLGNIVERTSAPSPPPPLPLPPSPAPPLTRRGRASAQALWATRSLAPRPAFPALVWVSLPRAHGSGMAAGRIPAALRRRRRESPHALDAPLTTRERGPFRIRFTLLAGPAGFDPILNRTPSPWPHGSRARPASPPRFTGMGHDPAPEGSACVVSDEEIGACAAQVPPADPAAVRLDTSGCFPLTSA